MERKCVDALHSQCRKKKYGEFRPSSLAVTGPGSKRSFNVAFLASSSVNEIHDAFKATSRKKAREFISIDDRIVSGQVWNQLHIKPSNMRNLDTAERLSSTLTASSLESYQSVHSPFGWATIQELAPRGLGLHGTSNTCAKCGLTFRMTSDLVYHMRTHHNRCDTPKRCYTSQSKSESLKCFICGEGFKERHHLTRHMTAHQDETQREQSGNGSNPKPFDVKI